MLSANSLRVAAPTLVETSMVLGASHDVCDGPGSSPSFFIPPSTFIVHRVNRRSRRMISYFGRCLADSSAFSAARAPARMPFIE
jgi:hypothetical protein